MDETTKLLKDLTEASGVSGYETQVIKRTKQFFQRDISIRVVQLCIEMIVT